MTAHPPVGSTLRKPLRLWPGVALGVLILVLRYVTPQIAPRLFEADTALNVTLFAFLGALLASILVLVWWLLFSRAPWVDRLLALGLVAVGFLAGPLVQDVSITTGAMGMLYPILVIPIVALAFVAWAALTRHLSDGVRRVTMAAAILLAFASLGLIRTGGFTAGMKHDFAWRWTPTPEERLLAAEPSVPSAAPAATPAPAPQHPRPSPRRQARQRPSPHPRRPPTRRLPRRRRRRARRRNAARRRGRQRRRPRRPCWPSGRAFAGRTATGSCAAPASRPTGARRPRSPCGAAPSGRAGRRSRSPAIASTRRSSAARTRWSRATTRRAARPCGTIATARASGNRTAAPGPRGTPTLSGGRVYALGATGIVNALDAATGARVWSRNAATDTGAKLPDWGFSGSPIVVDDLVIVAVSGALAAYDAATGQPRWKRDPQGEGYSSPHLVTLGGVRQVAFVHGEGITGVALSNGAVLWANAVEGLSHRAAGGDRGRRPAVQRQGTTSACAASR